MRIRVLGSAAGGGFPQWNCGCSNCRAVREGDPRFSARTQDSLAASLTGKSWLLLNASPDITRQIEAFDALHPREHRQTPIRAVVLTNGDLDHVLGLFSLRESSPLAVYATDSVREGLLANAMIRTLQRTEQQLRWRTLPLESEIEIPEIADDGRAMFLKAFPVPGKLPIHLQTLRRGEEGDNVGIKIRQGRDGASLVYVSGAAGPGDYIGGFEGSTVLFFDGTFWSSGELVEQGLSRARAEEMAHWPIGGPGGSLTGLSGTSVPRKFFTHINNSNPILRRDSEERRAVRSAGWEVASDGMEVEL